MASIQSDSNVLSGIWRAIRWPVCIVLYVAAVTAIVFAFKMLSFIQSEGGEGSVVATALIMVASAIGCILCALLTIIILIEDISQYGPSAWKVPTTVAVFQYCMIGMFYVIAGNTYPLVDERSPFVSSSGVIYLAGEEVPRRFFEVSGAHIDSSRQFQYSFEWNDPQNPELEFTTSVTIEATLTDNRRTLTMLVDELSSGTPVGLQVINNQIWDLYDPEFERLDGVLSELARSRDLSQRTVLESEVPWVESVRVVSVQTTVLFNN